MRNDSVKSSSPMSFNVYIMYNSLLYFTTPILLFDQKNLASNVVNSKNKHYNDIRPPHPYVG